MAFSNALTDYVDENSREFLSLAVTGSKTGQYCTWQPGIKLTAALQLLETDAVFQANTSCGFNASGTTAITQRTLTVAPTKVQETLCEKDLNAYWTQHLLKTGSYGEDAMDETFVKAFMELKSAKIAKQNELAMWQGDTGSGTAYLARFNGWLKILEDLGFGGAGDPINGNPTGITAATGVVAANAISIVDGIVDLIPESLLAADDLFIGMGWDDFRTWQKAIKTANLFHYIADITPGEAIIPGTSIKVIALPGITGTHRIVAGRWSNFYAGTDMMGEEDQARLYYAPEAETTRYSATWKLGVQIAFPAEVVYFDLVP